MEVLQTSALPLGYVASQDVYVPRVAAESTSSRLTAAAVAIDRVEGSQLGADEIASLTQSQVHAYLATPIWINAPPGAAGDNAPQLWGWLVVHQCRLGCSWRGVHGQVLQQIAAQIGSTLERLQLREQLESIQHQAAAVIEQTEAKYQQATRACSIGVWDWDLQTNDIYLDPLLKEMLGYRDAEIRNHIDDWAQYVYAEDLPQVMTAATEHLEGRSPEYRVEHRMVHRDGSLRWVLAQGSALRTPDGTPYRMVGTDIDITDRKIAELALERQTQQERAFNDVVQAVRSSLNLETIFVRAAESISAFLAGEVAIVQYLPAEECWRHQVVFNQGTREVAKLHIDVPDADNPFAERLRRFEIVQVDNTATIQDSVNRRLAETTPYRAWLIVPIRVEGAVWGSLTLARLDQTQPWLADTTQWAQRMADQLAIAIHQASLYQQLQAAHERDRLVLHSIGEGVWDRDLSTDQVLASDRYWEILGYDPQIQGASTFSAEIARIHPKDQPNVQAMLQHHLSTSEPFSIEYRVQHRQGHYLWMRARGQAVWDEQGHPVRMLGTIEDISDRKQAQFDLEQTRNLLQQVLDHLPICVFAKAADTLQFTLWNPACTQLLGYTQEEALGRTDYDLFPQAQAERCQEDDREAIASHHLWKQPEEVITNKTGQSCITHNRKVAVYDAAGKAQLVIGIVEDITARVTAENALRQREEEFRTLAENSPDGIFRVDTELRLQYVNPIVEKLLATPRTELIGKRITELSLPTASIAQWQTVITKAIESSQEQQLELKETYPTGNYSFLSRVVPERNVKGDITSVLVVSRDITSLQRAQKALLRRVNQEHSLRMITQHMRESLDLDAILTTAVAEVQLALKADRTLIFQLTSDHSGVVIQESVRLEYPATLEMRWEDEHFPAACYEFYQQGQGRIVNDIAQDDWGACLTQFMQTVGVQSKMVAPITQNQPDGTVQVWGLIITHACATRRHWKPDELDLLQQVAQQLAIALQQSELHQRLLTANQELEHLSSTDGLTR
jgi:PAS domain S-box-containing protein